MKDHHKNACMDIAIRWSKESKARRLKVGAVLVKDDNPLSWSWNGTPPGWDNNCEQLDPITKVTLVTRPEVLHAEENIIGKMARTGTSCDGATMFITHAPCINCARLMWKAGINHVIYNEEYRDTTGVDFLIMAGATVELLEREIDDNPSLTTA